MWYRFLSKYPLRFRRQYPIGGYIVDFYCHRAKLAVELDGSQHYEKEQSDYDIKRTRYLAGQGVCVLRYSNLDVLRQFDRVCSHIDMIAKKRVPHHSFPRGEAVTEGD